MDSKILEKRVVPVAVIEREEDAVPLAQALLAAGLGVIEVTLRTESAFACIRRIAKECPDMVVGAGTILTQKQVDQAREAGAAFGVAPGLNEAVLDHADAVGLPFVPGVMTPSEIERALARGLRILKFFPAEPAGGVRMLESLAGPYAHTGVKFIPLGGVSAANVRDYLALPVVAAIGGTWFLKKDRVQAGDWDGIRRMTEEALALTAPA